MTGRPRKSSDFGALAALARSGHGSANYLADGDRIAPNLRSAIFPALGYGPLGPRLRKMTLPTNRLAPYLRRL